MEKENINKENKIYILCDYDGGIYLGAYTDKSKAHEDWDYYEQKNKGSDCYLIEEVINSPTAIADLRKDDEDF